MKNLKLKNKKKKITEKERLQNLLREFTLSQKFAEERVARYEDLVKRSSSNSEKLLRNSKRLDEARKLLAESLVFVNHLKEALEKAKEEKSQ